MTFLAAYSFLTAYSIEKVPFWLSLCKHRNIMPLESLLFTVYFHKRSHTQYFQQKFNHSPIQ